MRVTAVALTATHTLALPIAEGAATSTCLTANNFLNAQYTVDIGVGTPPQNLSCVMDTGSYELIIASSACQGCDHHTLFDGVASASFRAKAPEELITTMFGQGKVVSQAAYETATVGNISVADQSVLLMQLNELRDYDDAVYDGIVGLGVSDSARRSDSDLSLMAQMGVDEVSICFGQFDGEAGRVEFGKVAEEDGLEYTELPVVGDQHWAVDLSSVALRFKDGTVVPIRGCDKVEGLSSSGCNGIIDSGTSLIAVPTDVLDSLLDQIGDVDPQCAGVDQLPTLELGLGDLTISIPPQIYVAKMEVDDSFMTAMAAPSTLMHLAANQSGVAPASASASSAGASPSAWDPFDSFRQRVQGAVGSLGSGVGSDVLPRATPRARRNTSVAAAATGGATTVLAAGALEGGEGSSSAALGPNEACVALLMDMELASSLPGRPWILGIPLLRAYKARFDRAKRTVGLAQLPLGSEHCSSCSAAVSPPTQPRDFFPSAVAATTSSSMPTPQAAATATLAAATRLPTPGTHPAAAASHSHPRQHQVKTAVVQTLLPEAMDHQPPAAAQPAAAAAPAATATATADRNGKAAAPAAAAAKAGTPVRSSSSKRSAEVGARKQKYRPRMALSRLHLPHWVRQTQYEQVNKRHLMH